LGKRRDLVVVIVAGGDFLRHDLVVLGLRLIRVGDRRNADLEVALRLRQRLDDGLFLALRELDVELRQEHVEIRGRNAQDEVLPRELQHVVRLRDDLLGLIVGHEILVAEQRLRRRHEGVVLRVSRRDIGLRIGLDRGVVLVLCRTGRCIGVRQQARARLRQIFLGRLPVRLCGSEQGVVRHGLAVDLHQILAARGSA
jgi:hypothetical protein